MSTQGGQWILCLDINEAFVQAARLAWPDRLGDAVHLLVGGHPDRRGTVASASYACRARGIRAGMPMRTALRMVPEARAVPVPWPVVKRKSREVMTVLGRYAEVVERASIDEAFARIDPGAEEIERYAHRIREAVLGETGMQATCGVSRLRMTAKMATNRGKPSRGGSGVYVVADGAEFDFIGEHAPIDIPYIGEATVQQLERRGVSTMENLRRIELATLTLWLGPARARFIHDRIRAIDPSPVRGGRGARKSVSAENTFAEDLYHLADLERELAPLVADVGATLRREGLYARTVGVKLRGAADFRDRRKSLTLPQFLQSDTGILRVARALLRELRAEPSGHVRLLGVELASLESAGAAVEQMTLDPVLPPLESDEERGHLPTPT